METINFNSDEVFIQQESNKISFKDFEQNFLSVSEQLEWVHENDLVLLDLKDPILFITYVFAILQKKAIPCLINSYFSVEQIKQVLQKNTYQWVISDQIIFFQEIAQVIKENNIQQITPDKTLHAQHAPKTSQINLSQNLIFYTSGSIAPKACVLSLKNLFVNAEGSFKNIPFQQGESWGFCLPAFHVGGFSIFIRALLKKGTVQIIDKARSLKEQFLGVDYVSLVSTQYIRWIQEIKKAPQKPKTILLGGSSIPKAAIQKGIELQLPIKKSYGMTEMGSQISTTSLLVPGSDLQSSGRVLDFRELKLIDKEICVRGECLFKGYLENNKIKSAVDGDGWFHTRDYGFMDAHGNLHVEGRIDRIFQSGGENISPEYIEQTLLSIPECTRCRVSAEIDDEYGFRAVAYVELVGLTLDEFQNKAKTLLKGFYLPKEFKTYTQISWKS